MAAFQSFIELGMPSSPFIKTAFLRDTFVSRSAAASQMRTEVGRDLTALARMA